MNNKLQSYNLRTLSTIVAFFIVSNYFFSKISFRLDLTSNSLYSVSNDNEAIFLDVKVPILATILLGEELPPSFEKLKKETEFLLNSIGLANPFIRYDEFDPASGNLNQVNAVRKLFAEKNVVPTNLRQRENNQFKEQLIYPFIHFQSAGKEVFVNVLESRKADETEQETIYRSIAALENKVAKAIHEISFPIERKVGFVVLDELIDRGSFEFVSLLKRKFQTEIILPKDLNAKQDSMAIAVVALADHQMSKENLFHIDQFLMRGGNVIWLLDEYGVSEDSISRYTRFIPFKNDHGISDFLFKSGVKLTGRWIQDLTASRIPQVVGEQGGQIQTDLFSFPFHPVMKGSPDHAISKSLEYVNLRFPTLIDTLFTEAQIRKIPLLSSSEYARQVSYPFEFSFDFLRTPLNPDQFGEKDLMAAILLEGAFPSYFENRLGSIERNLLAQNDVKFLSRSTPNAKQIVVADRDFLISSMNSQQTRQVPIGYNKWERRVFADNEKFLINAIEYLLNGSIFLENQQDEGLIFALIDKKMVQEKAQFWIGFNLFAPSVLLLLLFFGFQSYLKHKYA